VVTALVLVDEPLAPLAPPQELAPRVLVELVVLLVGQVVLSCDLGVLQCPAHFCRS